MPSKNWAKASIDFDCERATPVTLRIVDQGLPAFAKFEVRDSGLTDDDYWLTFDITSYQAPYLFQFAKQAFATAPLTDQADTEHYLKLAGELADIVDQLNAKIAGQVSRTAGSPALGR